MLLADRTEDGVPVWRLDSFGHAAPSVVTGMPTITHWTPAPEIGANPWWISLVFRLLLVKNFQVVAMELGMLE